MIENKKIKKYVLFFVMYIALFVLGYSIAELPEREKNMGDYAIVISTALTSFGCFWELYLVEIFRFKSSKSTK